MRFSFFSASVLNTSTNHNMNLPVLVRLPPGAQQGQGPTWPEGPPVPQQVPVQVWVGIGKRSQSNTVFAPY